MTQALECPQSFIVATECQKAAEQNGFRRVQKHSGGWAAFESTTVPGAIHLAAAGAEGPWFLAVDHMGVAEELHIPAAAILGPGQARYVFETLRDLYNVLSRVYQLAASLPDAPFQEFQTKTKDLPRATETERFVVQRIGQDVFRSGLMEYWRGRCPLTGITDPALLRASHIIPWKDCETDVERLDVHNGLLLSALWDAAFDRNLVSFNEEGQPLFSAILSDAARAELRWQKPIQLTDKHRTRVATHRGKFLASN